MFLSKPKTPDVVTIPINGCISASESKRSAEGINPDKFNRLLESVDLSQCQLVIIDINSGGGSPVGSSMIHDRILELRNDFPVIAHCRDICASGAYMIASACNCIYAHKSSIIGSIGVITSHFGLDRFIAKHDIDYREFTAGKSKGFLNPFKPVDAEKEELIKGLLEDCHQEFIDIVYGSRKLDRMNENKEEIITAKVFSGAKACEIGLIDGFKNPTEIIDQFTEGDINHTVIEDKESWLKKLFGFNINVKLEDLEKLEQFMRF